MKIKRRKFLKIAASFPVIGSTMIPKISSQQEKSNDEIQKLIEIIKLKYGERLSEDQMKLISEDIEANIRRRERLLSYKLLNWEEPDFKFQVKNRG
ncbi:hypothetical protein JGI7_00963 [Candidatus Kryptonium thompsonii]|uniref:Uncharacterized protein n=1 Tax=Candidatus Kryptonium thompsonii TaxID=1633631 RepID=A0A0P1LVK3_9BACT|nr:hypothetical protein [Candidatus Kryptonium thompsoni]CUS78364.1 hypothetical protein JGI14_100412 [Candidatus Kryptonium thompsoni]CUS85946.1 hypothetical protein JGI12_00921 [Candidatus Kryptonium thompsoni]CUS86094.1 hypothetical protein JGI7_00963 [Candidatus Kryptonium thompsoni]CUS89420.1 hypothetical protein JGI13_01702 [Candidatus Kryptonium thompsoni]CUT01961.1 hypothetical protein JGI5_01469 [Candidatus Kryptonium thompsoni]